MSRCDWPNGLILIKSEVFTVEGPSFPIVFHANYHLSLKGVNSLCLGLDHCKFQLLVLASIWRLLFLGLST